MIEDILAAIVRREGGYVDHPDDRGGATMYGITEAVARAAGYRGPMRDLPLALALDIYRRRYVTAPGFDHLVPISAAIAAEVVDTGVNMGPTVAARFLQRALNALNRQGRDYPDLVVDGVAGAATRAALAGFLKARGRAGEAVLLKALNALQGARYIELVEARPANSAFLFGWFNHRVSL